MAGAAPDGRDTRRPDAWSPPARSEGNVDLYVIGADGTLGARLTTAAEDDASPVISQ